MQDWRTWRPLEVAFQIELAAAGGVLVPGELLNHLARLDPAGQVAPGFVPGEVYQLHAPAVAPIIGRIRAAEGTPQGG